MIMEVSETNVHSNYDFDKRHNKDISEKQRYKYMDALRHDKSIYGKLYRYIQAQMITQTNYAWERYESLTDSEEDTHIKALLNSYYWLCITIFCMYRDNVSQKELSKNIKWWYENPMEDDDEETRAIKTDLYLNYEYIRKGLKEHLFTIEMEHWVYQD